MNAVIIRSFGGPEVLEATDVPQPSPGDHEVLIHVRAAGVNPVDHKVRSGSFAKQEIQLPTVLGRDVAGTIEAFGRGVTGYQRGDAVYAFLGSYSGGYAQYAVAKEDEVALKPKSLD